MREARKAFGEGERRLGGLLRGLPPVVNAVFRTHHGDINVDLAIVGMTLGSTKGRSRARVLVSSRYGHIRLNFVGYPFNYRDDCLTHPFHSPSFKKHAALI